MLIGMLANPLGGSDRPAFALGVFSICIWSVRTEALACVSWTPIESVSKSNFVILTGYIIIFDIAENEIISSPDENIRGVTCWNKMFGGGGRSAKPSINCDYVARFSWFPVVRNWRQLTPNVHEGTKFLDESRATPIIDETIFDEDFDFSIIYDRSPHTRYFELVGEHMRPIGVSGSSSGIGGNPSRPGKAHCEQAEDGCENGYDDSCSGRNDRIVISDRPFRAVKDNSATRDERDDFFLPLMLCAVLAACLGATLLVR
jgi:hypothetical protein